MSASSSTDIASKSPTPKKSPSTNLRKSLKKIVTSKSKVFKKKGNKGGNYRGNKRPNFPLSVRRVLKSWLFSNPYPFPTNTEKYELCEITGLKLVRIYKNYIILKVL